MGKISAKSKYKTKALEESSQEDRMRFTALIKQITSDQLGQVVEIIDKKSPQALKTARARRIWRSRSITLIMRRCRNSYHSAKSASKRAAKAKRTERTDLLSLFHYHYIHTHLFTS